ncbi:MAG: PorV/PorQ family protein [Deferribacteres bacterium]|nr:PorV/PorQ family protein [candidate division KSB1 bacterium]MCB9500880.1 PorV/PorQ family protein [Deferribacteres bacterium]
MRKYWFCVFLVVISFINQCFSQNATARFLLWQPSARSIAMGGAGVALTDNAFAPYYNPALLGVQTTHYQAAGSFGRPYPFMHNTVYSFMGVTLPIPNIGVLALSTNRYWIERQAITGGYIPSPTGLTVEENSFLNPTHWDIKIAFGTELNDNLSIGGSMALQRINFMEYGNKKQHANELLLGFGILYQNLFPQLSFLIDEALLKEKKNIKRGIQLGLGMNNVGPKISVIDPQDNDHPPTYVTLGFAYAPLFTPHFTLSILSDFEKQFFNDAILDYIHWGQEAILFSVLAFRAGYFMDTCEPHTSYKTIGAGLITKYASFNIARYNRSLQSTWHFDITFAMELK